MQYVYMNERIRQKRPQKPVIVVLKVDADGHTESREANRFAIKVDGRVIGHVVYEPHGLDACETHEVKAWVEFNDDVRLVREPTQPKLL